MKSIKVFLMATAAMLAFVSFSFGQSANKFDIHAANGKYVEYGREASITTTDSVLTTLDIIPITANEAGIITVTLVGYNGDAPAAITGIKEVRYKKVAGTLTLGTVNDIVTGVTDTELSGSTTWSIVASSNNIYIKVKGKLPLASGVKWRARTELVYRKS